MNKIVVFGLITIISLMGTVRGLTRKYIMRYMSNLSIVFIDAFISGFFMSIAALYFGGLKQLKKDFKQLKGKVLLAFVASSILITISIIIGYELLRTQKLGYLVLIETGIGIIATMLASHFFLGEKITVKKIFAIPILLAGVYLAQ